MSRGREHVITVRPRYSREDGPGPHVFVSGNNPESSSTFVSPMWLYRRRVIFWFAIHIFLFFFLIEYFQGGVLTPPPVVISYRGEKLVIPKPGWSPDPVVVAAWILLLGSYLSFILFNYMRFSVENIKYVALMEVGSTSGVPYLLAAPKPVSSISPREFLYHLGRKYFVYPIAQLAALAGEINSLRKGNKVLRGQALAYDDMLETVQGVSKMIAGSADSSKVVAIRSPRTAFLLIITNLITAIIVALIVLSVTGGVQVVQPSPTTTPIP